MRRLSLSLLLGLGLAFGCGESTMVGEDAGIRFDATPMDSFTPDGGPDEDAGSMSDSDIGEACRGASDCEGICLEDFPGGYCSNVCGGGGDACPDGSACITVGRGTQICLAECDPTEERPCREGYGCTDDARIGNICIPGCTDDSDCTDGLTCDPDGGFAGEGTCFDPSAEYGDPCMDELMCPADGFCLEEDFAGWPGGACIGFDCNLSTNEGCIGDAQCVPSNRGDGLCIDGCETADDCRDGYDCVDSDTHPGRLTCRPACTTDDQCTGGRVCNPAVGRCDEPFSGELGEPCSTVMGACAGGTCFTEFDSGFPGSYCSFLGCDASAADADDGCPDDGVCRENEDGSTFCMQGCEDSRDCRGGDYECRPVDPDDASAGMGCFPACTSDDACANDGTDGAPDFSCNPGTGLCGFPFEAARLGEPCEDGDDCPGGVCVAEATDGYPAGMCVSVGCALTGDGPERPCDDGGVCVDDESGDPAYGVCVTACTTETSGTCRPGYACAAIDAGPDGTCVPACEADDCSGGRTCNTETGLCES